VARKSISCRKRWLTNLFSGILALGLLPGLISLCSADNLEVDKPPNILGAASCSSSACHGGGGANQNQFHVWSWRDFHSQRPFATLTTARSKQISESLGIKDPTGNLRCTICHAPLLAVPAARRPGVQPTEGITCESCHGPAEPWLRGHTRHDWSRADRTAAGMRDLQDLYKRANICVTCHQTVELPLLKAGHPELLFEMDGQTVSEPRHWREATNFCGGQAWFVGQTVALRELSWQISREGANDQKLNARWLAAQWLIRKGCDVLGIPTLTTADETTAETVAKTLTATDQIARQAAQTTWTIDSSQKVLRALARAGPDFRDSAVPNEVHARRAERLVLALDRLKNDLRKQAKEKGDPELDSLFSLAQSIPDFDRDKFAAALEKFSRVFDEK
jgi:hypothetical protein